MVSGLMSPAHMALLLLVVLMLFGSKRLPEMGRSLGSGLRGFKESLEGSAEEQRHVNPQVAASTAEAPPVPNREHSAS